MSDSTAKPLRVAAYARVSTTGHGQTADNQLLALRSFATARGWTVTEFVDSGQSGKKEKRPQLDAMLAAVKARKVDVVACVKLDRLARSVSHLVRIVHDFDALGVDLVVLDQAIDTTTPSGRLLFHVLASVAEFELDLIRDRIMAGLARARAQGKRLGPKLANVDVAKAEALISGGMSMRAAARELGASPETLRRRVALSHRAEASARTRAEVPA
jgi:DNA invertase Pin-like site-specific DNA recombinase